MVSEKQGDFLLGEIGEGEGEVIELVDVVGEPEPKMSIDNFVPPEKEKSFGEMTPLEPWEKLEFDEKPEGKAFTLRPEREIGDIDLAFKRKVPSEEASPGEELFEKIELEEVLEKVEQLKPDLEKEWPSESEVRYVGERSFKMEEPAEKYLDLQKFEAAPQKEVKAGLPEEEPEPLFMREPKREISQGAIPIEGSVEEEEIQPFSIEEPKEEISAEAIPMEESVEEEELEELPEEEFPEELLEEMLGDEEISAIGRPKEAGAEEIKMKKMKPEAIRMETLEEFKAPRIFEEEIKPLVTAVSRQMEALSPLVKVVDKHLEEVIAKGIQDMVGDFITKILPEMTQHIIGLTAERIEKMVRELVPDLAEKAIQEELKRLQKGEKG
jgi:hypothetical protein